MGRRTGTRAWTGSIGLVVALSIGTPVVAQPLPAVPVPPENPITEEKRILGKILFWEEQLSSDSTVACGSCHGPARGGADGRTAIHPGFDGSVGTPDDVVGSPGIARADSNGQYIVDPDFGLDPQVTARAANTFIGAGYPAELFWDGRAGTTFLDPADGTVSIPEGGALENQAVVPILSDVEMAKEGRTWTEVITRLDSATPLRYATELPADVESALLDDPSYPDLFQAAFGDPTITAERIAFAIATYQRTLVPDETPWDRFIGGESDAMTSQQVMGWIVFSNSPCAICHQPPLFTDQTFRNIGLRPIREDAGRGVVTGDPADRGRFKVPTLRNVGLKATFMHNGRLTDIPATIDFYLPDNPDRFPTNMDPLLPIALFPEDRVAIADFLQSGLTDPRVAAEVFPFDRPTLHGGDGLSASLSLGGDGGTLEWFPTSGAQTFNVYRGDLSGLTDGDANGLPDAGYGDCLSGLDPDPTDTSFADFAVPATAGSGFFYLVSRIDALGAESLLGTTSDGQPRVVTTPCPVP